MITGSCPECDELNMTPIGEPGKLSVETCQHCKKEYWLKHSRIDPTAYPRDYFTIKEDGTLECYVEVEK